ncbi:MAG: RtcB family protein [Nanoarchaeota archaeon]|nr:RtcB family protein [Nanoarchaeota archaeon]
MEIQKINDYEWKIPKTGGMNAPGVVFASKKILDKMMQDNTLQQVQNVAHLPGILKHSIVLPDGHWGYGFPIGGVAAFDAKQGLISPGGVGFDINCGVRLVRTNLQKKDVDAKKIKELIDTMFTNIPSGLGSKGKIRVNRDELDEVLSNGVQWAVNKGYGWKTDAKHIESDGCLKNNDPSKVSDRAKTRGMPQLGSLGAGNHFVEIEYVQKIENPEVAEAFGLKEGQICVMIHTGSRGLGHQNCSDYIRVLEQRFSKEVKELPDRQLVYAPSGTQEFHDYFKAMNCAANYAWTNRQMITHWTRQSFQKVFGRSAEELDMRIVYDVAHNIAKQETHVINGEKMEVIVHRKGATRAFPAGHEEVPEAYKKVGQPVLIPGHMGIGSWVLVGVPEAMNKTFGSTAHGAGRAMSRGRARHTYRGEQIKKDLAKLGIYLRAASWKVVSEEAPGSYKDLDEVVRVSHEIGIAHRVAGLRPLGVMKG